MEWIILAIVVGAIFFAISIYNRLVAGRNRFKNAFAQIDVQLTRRHDLIPNLVETAKGYMSHERETLEAVVNARNMAVAEQGLSGALGRLFALSEAYPDLKANENMMQLSEELTTTENKVAFSRQAYNDSVMDYNTLRESFPNNLFAGWFSFRAAELLEIEEESMREAPKVSF